MLSRAIAKPHLCWACRHSLLRRSQLASASGRLALHQRHYASKKAISKPAVLSAEDFKSQFENFQTTREPIDQKPVPIVEEPQKPILSPEELKSESKKRERDIRKFIDRIIDPDAEDWKRPWNEYTPSIEPLEQETLDRDSKPETESKDENQDAEPDAGVSAPEQPPSSKRPRQELVRTHTLDVASLGLPLETIIVKNPTELHRTRKPLRSMDELKPQDSGLDWSRSAPVEDQDEAEAVRKNIEELKPQDTTIISRKEFDHVMDILSEGFTFNQLSSYRSIVAAPKPPRLTYSWLMSQYDWVADEAIGYGSLKPKQNQALRIMREDWGLEIREHIEGLGTSGILLTPVAFDLIARQQPSPILEVLKAEFLNEDGNESITADAMMSRLDIHTQKNNVPAILQRIDEILQTMTSRSVSVKDVDEDNLRPELLVELERVTSTSLKLNMTKELEVSWLVNEDRPPAARDTSEGAAPADLRIRDTADLILRLLQGDQTAPLPPNKLHVLSRDGNLMTAKKSATAKGSFLHHRREKRSMSWRDKLRSWSRYAYPVSNDANLKPFSLSQKHVHLGKFPKLDGGSKDRITATFGHILHSQTHKRWALHAPERRIISPLLPPPASFSAIVADNDSLPVRTNSILLKFAPDKKRCDELGLAAPEVQLNMPVDPGSDLTKFTPPQGSTSYHIASGVTHDVLLPQEAVDVRISQDHVFKLSKKHSSLQAFLAASDFDLLQGRLRTPGKAQFSIPWRLLGNAPGGSTGKRKGDADVPYVLRALEVHQTVELQWRDHILRYNSIEAGQGGGQRQELSIVASLVHSQNPGRIDEQVDQFLELVSEIAKGERFSWGEGHKLVQQDQVEALDEELGANAVTPESPAKLDTYEDNTEEIPGIPETPAELDTYEDQSEESKDVQADVDVFDAEIRTDETNMVVEDDVAKIAHEPTTQPSHLLDESDLDSEDVEADVDLSGTNISADKPDPSVEDDVDKITQEKTTPQSTHPDEPDALDPAFDLSEDNVMFTLDEPKAKPQSSDPRRLGRKARTKQRKLEKRQQAREGAEDGNETANDALDDDPSKPDSIEESSEPGATDAPSVEQVPDTTSSDAGDETPAPDSKPEAGEEKQTSDTTSTDASEEKQR